MSVPGILKKEKIFFPNLDALRFLSFLSVFLYHSYKILFIYVEKSAPHFFSGVEFLFRNGNMGVNFFFVLSGFLITYLLIKEKEKTGKVNLRNFYIRRLLRIWPLFYLCVFIGFVIFPLLKTAIGAGAPNETAHIAYYLLLINNFDFINNWPLVPDATILIVLWSVAVEEQFYLAWPVIVQFIAIRRLKFAFFTVIIASLVFRFFHNTGSDADYAVRYFNTLSVVGDMALGGVFALYTSKPGKFLYFIRHLKKPVLLLIYAIAVVLTLFRQELFVSPVMIIIERLIIAVFYGLIILEQCFSEKPLFHFSRFKIFSKLGTYTYGLYCWHFLVISAVVTVGQKINIPLDKPYAGIGIMLAALGSVILLAFLSYHLYENRFLKLKDRFAVFVKK
jgi:peptidoglycan/LPS O-acetylase OafA/YrhL